LYDWSDVATDTKQRMTDAAADLLSQHGTAGATIDAVLALSAAPRGSVYYHFPGGRNEMVLDAVRMVGDRISRSLKDPADPDPQLVLDELAAFWRRHLLRTEYRGGCPVVALAVGGAELIANGEQLVADIFETWQISLMGLLTDRGVGAERSRRLAALVLSAIQGAVVLCRVQRSSAALDDVVAELSELLSRAA
jgi:TetR/AcrR family transcriptional repressor of lmrAB and yxaGH operons